VRSKVPDIVDIAVIGGGIVGLASARAALLREPDARVVVLEKEAALATHQSSRNSGVVHAGIYYKPGSLKARLCTAGRERLKEYALRNGLPYVECGKLIVALRDEEMPRLDELERRAAANGVPGVRRLDAKALREVEPAARGVAGLHSPVTAITDYGAVARSYARDIEAGGGDVLCGFKVTRLQREADQVTVGSADGRTVRARRVLVCAGLHSDRMAMLAGDSRAPRIVPFRGDYYRLRPERAALVRALIYPVPDPDLPFLGVHLTRTVAGEVLVGPNAVLAGAREGYSMRTFRPGDLLDAVAWPGFWRFAGKYWRTGLTEVTRAMSKRRFAQDAAAYVPGIVAGDLERARSGVRAQALDTDGAMVDDFAIRVVDGVVNVRNAPSPAATSSLPIADEIVKHLFV
jgi:L-2-hydroxyglutarate oxidase